MSPEVVTPTARIPQQRTSGDQQAKQDACDAFWSARAYLKHIHEAAWAVGRAPDAVLGAVLARTAALVDHRLLLPAIVGAPASLSLFSVIVAPSGGGKSTANDVAARLMPAPEDFMDVPVGTGEGIAEAYYGTVDEDTTDPKTGKPKVVKVRRQVRHNAFFYVDEGQAIAQISARNGATLMPTLRSAFTGGMLGQQNADEARRRVVKKHTYSIGVVIGIQDKLAGDLMGDTDGGTSQRFLWFSAIDPTVPDYGQFPTWPGRLGWGMPELPPAPYDAMLIEGMNVPRDMTVDWAIMAEIGDADVAKTRGASDVEVIDSHAMLIRLKLAALLAVLDGRTNVIGEDWALAGQVKARSDAMRDSIMGTLAAEKRRQIFDRDAAQADSAICVEEGVEYQRLNKTMNRIRTMLVREPDCSMTRTKLQQGMSPSQRDYLELALIDLIGQGAVRDERVGDKRVIRWTGR